MVASVLFIALGAVIVVRSVSAHVYMLVILGAVFVALGIVRLREQRAAQG